MRRLNRQRNTSVAVSIGIALWIAAPLLAFYYLQERARHEVLATPQEVWAPVRQNVDAYAVSVDVALKWGAQPSLVAPTWSGTVVDVDAHVGKTIITGDNIVRIDGLWRIAAATRHPFYRALSLGDEGEDARDLNKFLKDLGLDHDDGGDVTLTTLKGIRRLAAKLGGSDKVSSFDPSWVIYLPSRSLRVQTVEMSVGAPAPAAGEVLMKGSALLVDASIVATGSGAPVEDLGNEPEVSRRTQEGPQAPIPVVASKGQALMVAGRKLRVDSSRSRVARESWKDLLRGVTPGEGVVNGELISPPQPATWKVPPSAIFTNSSDQPCVIVRGPGKPRRVARVALAPDAAGEGIVTGSFTIRDSVLLQPPLELRTCV